MRIVEEGQKEKIWKKLARLLQIDPYFDGVLLSPDAFEKKYGYLGGDFTDFYQIRFEQDVEILQVLTSFLDWEDQYFLLPISPEREIYSFQPDGLASLIEKEGLNTADFLIVGDKYHYVLVKDKHRKLTGMGDFIRKRIKKQLNFRFLDARLMFATHDEGKEE